MLSDSVPVPEIVVPADAWASPVVVAHALTHSDLERLTAEFLAEGRVIDVVPSGIRTYVIPEFNRPEVHRETDHLADDQRAHLARLYAGDSALVAHIAVQLPAKPRRKQLLQELQCGNPKLQRLLNMYFADDPNAAYLRKGDANRDACVRKHNHDDVAELIRQNAELSIPKIAVKVGLSESLVRRVVAEYGIKVKQCRFKGRV